MRDDPPTFSLSLVPPPDAAASLDPAYVSVDVGAPFERALIFLPVLSIPLLESDERPLRAAG